MEAFVRSIPRDASGLPRFEADRDLEAVPFPKVTPQTIISEKAK
jgi:hypothetical protein